MINLSRKCLVLYYTEKWGEFLEVTLIVSALLLLTQMFTVANATDRLIKEPDPTQQPVQSESHIAWQDFQARLGSYTRVRANMTDSGVISLRGFVGPFEEDKLEALASRVEGATKVLNYTGTK